MVEMETAAKLLWLFMGLMGLGATALAAYTGRRYGALCSRAAAFTRLLLAVFLQGLGWMVVVFIAANVAMQHESGEDSVVGLWPFVQALLFAVCACPLMLVGALAGFFSKRKAGGTRPDGNGD